MVKVAGNLKELIDSGAARYISLNKDKFKSTTSGPMGPDGPRGPEGVGVHHMKGTSTTDPEGDFSTAGELDTYTFYADVNERIPLAWFTVKNGENPWLRAIDRGYRGTEEEFYELLSSIEEYAELAEEAMETANSTLEQVTILAEEVEDNREIVELNREIVDDQTAIAVEKGDLAKDSLDSMQELFLGQKGVDPTTDNLGNPLQVGALHYNIVQNTMKVWTGTDWAIAVFSADGLVVSFNGRDGAITLTNTDVSIATGVDLQTKVPEIEGRISTNEDDIGALESEDANNKLRLDTIEDAHLQLDERVDILESDVTVMGSVENKIVLLAQEGIYDDANGLGVDTIKEALDKLVLDLYKIKEW